VAGGVGGAIGGAGMLNGSVGEDLANINASGQLAKYLGLESGQEMAEINRIDLLIQAGKTALARTLLGDLATSIGSIPSAEAAINK
jgi:hypothetical protein